MPAATSPYQNNDYQAVSTFRPYQLPVNDIFRALTAQNQFWEQGAQKVKGAYESALDLNIVTDKNREIKDLYMKDAEKQISKLSSMDLADPTVQRQGLNIFKPLLSNENIIGEDYVVRSLNKEIANGLSYRDKDNGKEFNPLSLENIQFEKQLFRGALNKEDGWKSLYGNMSTYTPYSDNAAELKKITDLLKAEEIKNAQITPGNEWMINEINKKGVSKERILGAIEEMGSPQLKAQMRVEGRNTYYKHLLSDPNGVDGYFQGVAANLMDQKIGDLSKNKAELEYQKYLIPDNADNKTKRDAVDAAINSLDKTIVDLQTKQKPEFISNFQNLSNVNNLSANVSRIEQLWQSASINSLAPKLAWESSSQELKPNNAKIAFENVAIAKERLNFNYRQLAEQNRHNVATEDDAKQGRILEALRLNSENGNSTGTGPGGNVVFGGVGDNGSPTPEIGTDSPESKAKVAEAARNSYLGEINNREEKLRETTISTVISPNTWARIQQNGDDSKIIGETGVLTDYDIEKASEFLNAFSNKNAGKSPLPGTGQFEATNQNDWKRWLKGTSIGAFKRIMGKIAGYDNEFTSDLIVKLSQEGDDKDPNKKMEAETRLATFRATLNDNTKFNLNSTKTLFPKQIAALGEYSKYFDNNGGVAMSDVNIEKAYNTAGDNLAMYYSQTLGDARGFTKKMLTRSEYLKKKDENHAGISIWEEKPTLSEFKSYVRSATDPIFYEHDMQFNTQSYTHFYSGKGAEENKFRDAQQLGNIAQYENSDNVKVKDAVTFIQNHTKNIVGYKANTPRAEEQLPSISYVMEGLSKEDQAVWESIKTPIQFKPADGSPLLQRGNSSSKFRFPGAVISYTNINNPEAGNISITNEENGTGDIDPRVSAKDVYFISNGKKVAITSAQIQDMIEKKYQMPLATLLKTNPEQVDLYLAGLATNIELQNKKAKEKK